MPKIKIRFLKPRDLPFTAEICNDCWETFYPAYIGKNAVARAVAARKKRPFKFRENTKKNFAFVALLNGKIVGYAVGAIESKKAHLIALYVSPKQTNIGIGSALIKRALKQFAKSKPKKFFIETMVKNRRAQKLYASFGLKPVRKKWFYSRGVKRRVLVMEKVIN